MSLQKKSTYTALIVLFAMCFITSAYAQNQITASGVVIDQNGDPMIGATVMVESNRTGTITDIDGRFSLSAQAGERLSFSFIGFNTVYASAATGMTVRMQEDMVTLDALVVVGIGYGTMRRQDLTGAISSVQASDLRQGVITSAEQTLQGRVAGLVISQPSGDPAGGSTIRLRGGTSLSASNTPLIVVDGIPGVDINTVQPSDIVSIDVLKDASAAAIFGSRGANGVIIVTTNRGGQGFQMNYTGFVGVSTVANQLDMLSANQWRRWVRENNVTNAVDFGGNTDWQRELQQTGFTQNHSLSFSNGSDRAGMRASVTYLDTKGVLITSGLRRLAGSIAAHQFGFNNRLRLDLGLNATRDNWSPINIAVFERALNLNPTIPVRQNGEFTQVGGTNVNNPVEILTNRQNNHSRIRLLGHLRAELEIIEGLTGTVSTSYEYNSHQVRYFGPSYAFFYQSDRGFGRRSLGDFSNAQIETFFNYNTVIDGRHRLNLMAGYSFLENTWEGFAAERRGFGTNLFGYNNLAAGSDLRQFDATSWKGMWRVISVFGRVNYVFADRYMFTATLRRDGSSRFGANHRWGTFPSASVAWRISEEDFMGGTRDWLDHLRLRVGYGVTGNQDGIAPYGSLQLMGAGGGFFDPVTGTWQPSFGVTQNANPDLRWESTAQTNIGIDAMLFNRFNVTIDAYLKRTSDLLYMYPVPQPPFLYHQMMANVGNLENRGIEFTLGANIIRHGEFRWNANLTMAYNRQRVTSLSNDQFQIDAVSYGNLHGLEGFTGVFTQTLREGYPVGTFWGPRFLGVDENGGWILNRDESGNLIYESLGSAQPRLTTGLTMDFSFRNFDLNIAGYGMFGQRILNAQAMTISYLGRLPSRNIPYAWLNQGITAAPAFSDFWIERGDFFRLSPITLGYTLPVRNEWVSRVRFFCTIENLFTFTGYTGLDPEVNFAGLASPGIDKSMGVGSNFFFPRARTFSMGVNLSF